MDYTYSNCKVLWFEGMQYGLSNELRDILLF